MSSLSLKMLGPLRLWRNGVELDPGPAQASLLALLVAGEGRPISMQRLIDLMWDDDPPASANNIVHKYVSGLRRMLEPALPVHGRSAYLLRRGAGYVFVATPGTVDVAAFREHLRAAEATQGEAALDKYVEALRLWRGAAGDGLRLGSNAEPIFAALNSDFSDACVAAAELGLSLGRPDRVLGPLRMAATLAPLHEPVHASLILELAAAGRQAEALAVFKEVRERLVDELGIDPGSALITAHQRVLSRTLPPPSILDASTPTSANGMVGRAAEQDLIEETLAKRTGLILIEGEPGVGKTRLLEEAAAIAHRRGALVAWGPCIEGPAAPSMWPWVQVIGTVLDDLPPVKREKWLSGDLGRLLNCHDDIDAAPGRINRFHMFEQVVSVLHDVAATRRTVLVVVLDDLQWADLTSLQLFRHIAARLPGDVVMVGALRDRAPRPGDELTRTLASASRMPGHRRIRLGPFGPDQVAELIRRETGREPSADTARAVHVRTAGNPFFVRELIRTAADDDLLAATVPATVRDVIGNRVSELDRGAGDLLRTAALIGKKVDIGVLARTAGLDVESCLGRLEPAVAFGLLEPAPEDPSAFRFVHDLVRESIAETVPSLRAPMVHLRIADALEGSDQDGERLAHHLRAAGPLADPARTVGALIRAGHNAASRFAFETAERHLQLAGRIAREFGHAEGELSALTQLIAVVGMGPGYIGAPLKALERAERLARGLSRTRDAADFLFARWLAHLQGVQIEESGRLARRLREQSEASDDPEVRAYGQHAWGIHQWEIGNVGAAYRFLRRSDGTMLENLVPHEDQRLRHDLQLLSPMMLGLISAMHGDMDAARALAERADAVAGDDPYAITMCATFAAVTATMIGDPAWALRAAERGIAADPEFTFVFYGRYQRLARCWALAMTGDDPAGAAAEAEQLAAALDPPRTSVATWYGVLADTWLAAGNPARATAALDHADELAESLGQRSAEGLLLLLRARLLKAVGEPAAVVRAAAERARALSAEREAYLFARRAEELLAQLNSEESDAPTVRADRSAAIKA